MFDAALGQKSYLGSMPTPTSGCNSTFPSPRAYPIAYHAITFAILFTPYPITGYGVFVVTKQFSSFKQSCPHKAADNTSYQ